MDTADELHSITSVGGLDLGTGVRMHLKLWKGVFVVLRKLGDGPVTTCMLSPYRHKVELRQSWH